MVEIVLNSEDLEKLPKELRDGLKEYIFGKSLAPDLGASYTAPEEPWETLKKNLSGARRGPLLEEIHARMRAWSESGEEKAAILEKIQALMPAPSPVDTMSVEAAIAFLFGLDPATSLSCVEYFINSGAATKETLARVAGKKDTKGVNGLIGSINRRFKSLFLYPAANQNIINYRKGEKVYVIDETFHPALRFGLWAVRSDVDWESCKQIIWPVDQEEIEYAFGGRTEEGKQTLESWTMPMDLKLNIVSIRVYFKNDAWLRCFCRKQTHWTMEPNLAFTDMC